MYTEFDYTEEEITLLMIHDADEELHSFISRQSPLLAWQCAECGDTAEGLMHNNTWRNVEPLMVPDCGEPGPDCVEHNGACD